jgi:glycosyltransferase involved in cell wall biosynthesis
VVGCTPPEHVTHRNLRVFSFLSKNNVEERAKLESLYLNADFFLLPTRADCSPIVLCEAAAFGLPVISTDTGGVSDIVRNGENGVLLPPTAKGSEYARVIADSYRDTQRFQRMRRRSRELYDTRLNWDAWGKTVAGLIGKPKSFSKAAGH